MWSAAMAIAVVLLLGGSEFDARALSALVAAAIVAYVTWPAFAVGLPPSYAIKVTTGGVVTAILVGLAYAAVPVVVAGIPTSIATLFARFVGMLMLSSAFAIILSILAARVFNR